MFIKKTGVIGNARFFIVFPIFASWLSVAFII